MEQTATVKSVNGNIALVEVSRKAMCDGCHKTECGTDCAMSGLFSSGKTMTANAVNKVGAAPGDTVQIETSDKSVLFTAMLVFFLPVILGGVFYFISDYLNLGNTVSAISALVGFVIPFIILKAMDNKQKDREPRIVITRILSVNESADGTDLT